MNDEPCVECDGAGELCTECGQPAIRCQCEPRPAWHDYANLRICPRCNATGKQPITEGDTTEGPTE